MATKIRADFTTHLTHRFDRWMLVTEATVPYEESMSPISLNTGTPDELRHLASFTLEAYVGDTGGTFNELDGDVWGFSRQFRPSYINRSEDARSMARLLTKVDKGLWDISASAGELRTGDYAGYVYRVASILGIKNHYWRHGPRDQRASGEYYRALPSLGALAYEIQRGVDAIKAGDTHHYAR